MLNVAVRGPGREVFYGSEISGHSRILRGSRCKATILASSPWGADAAAPLIGASARGGMGGGGARVLRNRIRSLHTPKIGGGHPTFDMWPLCKVRVSCARFGNYQDVRHVVSARQVSAPATSAAFGADAYGARVCRWL